MNDISAAIAMGRRIDLTRESDFTIGGVKVEPAACQATAGDRQLRLQPRVMQVLIALNRAGGHPVSREALIEICWGPVTVGEDALNRCIQRLRRMAKDQCDGAFGIETIPRIGYRLTIDSAIAKAAESDRLKHSEASKPSVAVAPFANLSGEPDHDPIAEGMSEEIAGSLARIRTLFVVAIEPSSALKGKGSRLRDAAGDLGARYLIQGSVRKGADRIRVTVKLIDTVDGMQIWTSRFDGTADDVLTFQDDVALRVAGAIEPAVVAAEVRRVLKQPSEHPSSYELYLRAQPHCTRRSLPAYQTALDLLNRAIDKDPNYRSALALAAHLHSQIAIFGWAEDPQANRSKGIELARRAVMAAGDDAVVLAHAATAISRLEGDLDAAADLLRRAVTLNPASSYSWFLNGLHEATFGNPDSAIEHLETSLRLDPHAHRSNAVGALATARFRQGRFEEALVFAREAVQRVDGPTGHALVAGAQAQLGNASAAMAALDRYRALSALPLEVFAGTFLPHPAELRMFLDGIAAAEQASSVGDRADG